MTSECGVWNYLKGSFPHLTKRIWNFLDAKSLANAELVCREWRSSITESKCWKKHLLTEEIMKSNYLKLVDFPEEAFYEKDNKEKWLKIHHSYQKLHGNWKEEGSYTLSEIERSRIVCFTKNSTQLITVVHEAGEEFDEFLVKIWCRKTLHCEKVISEDDRYVESIDCNDEILVEGVFERDPNGRAKRDFLACIIVRDLETEQMIHRILEEQVPHFPYFSNLNESAFKVRFGHGLLITHRPIRIADEIENSREGYASRLEIRRMTTPREIEMNGLVRRTCITLGVSINLIFVGYDDNYIVVHRDNPPIFEIISTSTLELVRSFDALDNCCSAQYDSGLLASISSQMGSHTRTNCVIRLWDPHTGLCLREIQEPEPMRYGNMGHQIGFTNKYLVTVPDLPLHAKRLMKVRDLRAAIDPLIPVDLISLQISKLDWTISSHDDFLLDEFQLFYRHYPETGVSRLFVFSFLP